MAGAAGGGVDLEKELSCSICTDVLYQPLTLLDCLHTFCGSCLKEWFSWQATSATQTSRAASPYTCPSCRAIVRAARPNANVTTLLEMFLAANPGKGKTEQEKAEMRRQYSPGEDVMPPVEVHPESEDSEDERVLRQVQELSMTDRQTGRRARGSEDRPERSTRRRDAVDARRRQDAVRRDLTHQSSIRSLLSASDDPIEVQEEILNNILSSGMLDNIDIDNLTPEQEEELTTQIANAYRRRHRPRHRSSDSGQTPSTATAQSTPPRARQAGLSEQWGQDTGAGARRPTSSEGRSRETTTAAPAAVRSTTDPAGSQPVARRREPSARRNTAEVSSAAPSDRRVPRRSDTAQAQPRTPPAASQTDPIGAVRQTSPERTPPYPTADQVSVHPLLRTEPSRAPNVNCYRCNKTGIQHDLHYHCDRCEGGQLNLCLQCYRQARGCRNWYGFGYASSSRFVRNAPAGGWPANTEPPHTLQPRRYVKDTARLQEGAFCENCYLPADEHYWHCNTCLEGAWGFCSRCVRQDKHCTHPLTPVARIQNEDEARRVRGGVLLSLTLPHLPNNYFLSLPSTTCAITGQSLDSAEDWLHCSQCRDGDYDMGFEAYRSLMTTGKINSTSGLNGHRLCLQGHPMSILKFHNLTAQIKQRAVLADVIGGWNAKHGREDARGEPSRLTCLALWSWWPTEADEDELAFPKYAEIREVDKVNADYYLGVYAGSRGLFPANHVRLSHS